MAPALMPLYAGLDCGCLPGASRGPCSPLLSEHAIAVSLPLPPVSRLAALPNATACCPRHAAAVAQASPPEATWKIHPPRR